MITRFHDRWIVGGLLVCLALTLACWAQGPADDAKQLQANIQEMQKRLDAIRQAEEDADTRTRRIGKTKAPSRDDAAKELVVRMYDVGDLFSPAPAYRGEEYDPWTGERTMAFPGITAGAGVGTNMGGGMGGMGGGGFGGGGGFFDVPEKIKRPESGDIRAQSSTSADRGALGAARTTLDSLVEAITMVINPTQWEKKGGPCRISYIGSTVLITGTEDVHEQVDQLLDVFRRRWGSQRTITTELWWVWLTPDEYASLVPDTATPHTPVPVDAWKAIRKAKAKADPAMRELKITGFNGQTVFANAGESKTVPQSWRTVVRGIVETKPRHHAQHDEEPNTHQAEMEAEMVDDSEGQLFKLGEGLQVGLSPIVTSLNEGLAVQVTPLTSVSGQYATLDVHSRIVERGRDATDEKAPLPLRRKNARIHRLSTTIRIPIESIVLVGGSTFDATPAADGSNLYLFTRLSVQELRDERAISGNPAAKPKAAEEKQAEPPGK